VMVRCGLRSLEDLTWKRGVGELGREMVLDLVDQEEVDVGPWRMRVGCGVMVWDDCGAGPVCW
jgi:hypothetical protein